jgi:hypothetical protein
MRVPIEKTIKVMQTCKIQTEREREIEQQQQQWAHNAYDEKSSKQRKYNTFNYIVG